MIQIIGQKPDKLSTVLKILGREHSLMLFKLCNEGIPDTTKPEALGLSRKQYYTKLIDLKSIGLVMKNDIGVYEQTSLGKIVFGKLSELDGLEDKSKLLKMIDTLKKSGHFSIEDIDGFVEKVKENVGHE